MVMKDVATNFRWIYPSARSHAKDCVLAFRLLSHPVKRSEYSTLTLHHPSNSLVGKLGGDRTRVRPMFQSLMQSPRGISGPYLKGRE